VTKTVLWFSYLIFCYEFCLCTCGVFRYSVYYLEAIFGRGLDKSTLQSPTFSAISKSCLYLQYQISSPKIKLKIFSRTTTESTFELNKIVLFSDQEKIGTWSDASVELVNDVTQFQIVADKTGVSTNVHYVKVGIIELIPCPITGTL